MFRPVGQGVQQDACCDDVTVSGVWRATYQLTSVTTGTFLKKVNWTGL